MNIILKDKMGRVKNVKLGFSWTMFFFGFFVPLLRSDWKWAIITFLLAFVTFGLSWLVMPFLYNKLYIKDLISKGYKPTEAGQRDLLQSKGIVVPAE